MDSAEALDSPHTPLIYRTVALGCAAVIEVTDPKSLVGAIEILHDEVDRIDRAASRFRSDSEITRVHQADGRRTAISPCLQEAIAVAMRVADATDGAVDPTVGAAVITLGYDRDFAQMPADRAGSLPQPSPVPGWQTIELDPDAGTVRIPAGTLVDLGATAKALTADRIAQRVGASHNGGVLVALGGDIAVAGSPPPGGFLVGLAETSSATHAPTSVAIESGGMATSGSASRHWRLGGQPVHHIVDPSTGLPPAVMWRTVTVAAASCVDANAASTAAIVKGASAPAWLTRLDLPALLVSVDGRTERTAGWPAGDSEGLTPRRNIA
jgi:thiamine biosynthesis lipoprotein